MTVTAAATTIDHDGLYELEHSSIRRFVEDSVEHLTGRVLDFGCGEQPYRDIVERVGCEYVGYDRADYPGNLSGEDLGPWPFGHMQRWDAILCTQVVQYIPEPIRTLRALWQKLSPDGRLVLTFPTCWPEAETTDLHRFTAVGMRRMLWDAGFVLERDELRAAVELGGVLFPLGYGMVARR